MNRTKRPSRRGFTLVEAIATMAVLSAIGGVASTLVFSATRSFTDAANTSQLQSELSTAMSRMVRELRWVGVDASSAPLIPLISSVTPTSIAWNSNNSLSLVNGEILYVEAGAPAVVLLRNVSNLTISTFNDSNAALAATLSGTGCNPIRRIQISVTITRNGASQTLRTRVFPRSLIEGV